MGADRTERLTEPVEANGKVPDLTGKTVYVIDAYSLIYQVFHALPEMTSPRGEPTGAIFGFARDVIHLLNERKADYLLAAFDMSGPTFRHELHTAYKEDRSEMPDQLRPQVVQIRRMLAALGIPVLECESFEADDILATVARRVEQASGKCLLVTGDKDSRQLISDQVAVFNIRQKFGVRRGSFERRMGRAAGSSCRFPNPGWRFDRQHSWCAARRSKSSQRVADEI